MTSSTDPGLSIREGDREIKGCFFSWIDWVRSASEDESVVSIVEKGNDDQAIITCRVQGLYVLMREYLADSRIEIALLCLVTYAISSSGEATPADDLNVEENDWLFAWGGSGGGLYRYHSPGSGPQI
ncbi:hypothetical protein F4604DRAFT_1685921 [Suillus subluteus]|nr:hypothetical protein F4604DRAFT_1685921 [Suillus subluteus]